MIRIPRSGLDARGESQLAALLAEEAALDRLDRESSEADAQRLREAAERAAAAVAGARERGRAEAAAWQRRELELAAAEAAEAKAKARDAALALGDELAERIPAAVEAVVAAVLGEERPS